VKHGAVTGLPKLLVITKRFAKGWLMGISTPNKPLISLRQMSLHKLGTVSPMKPEPIQQMKPDARLPRLNASIEPITEKTLLLGNANAVAARGSSTVKACGTCDYAPILRPVPIWTPLSPPYTKGYGIRTRPLTLGEVLSSVTRTR